jgi:hypothetical protein
MDKWVDNHMRLTNADFREIAIDYRLTIASEWDPEEGFQQYIRVRRFSSSNGFLTDLKRAHDISSRRARFTRRSDTDVIALNQWIADMTQSFAAKSRGTTIDCGETP